MRCVRVRYVCGWVRGCVLCEGEKCNLVVTKAVSVVVVPEPCIEDCGRKETPPRGAAEGDKPLSDRYGG